MSSQLFLFDLPVYHLKIIEHICQLFMLKRSITIKIKKENEIIIYGCLKQLLKINLKQLELYGCKNYKYIDGEIFTHTRFLPSENGYTYIKSRNQLGTIIFIESIFLDDIDSLFDLNKIYVNIEKVEESTDKIIHLCNKAYPNKKIYIISPLEKKTVNLIEMISYRDFEDQKFLISKNDMLISYFENIDVADILVLPVQKPNSEIINLTGILGDPHVPKYDIIEIKDGVLKADSFINEQYINFDIPNSNYLLIRSLICS